MSVEINSELHDGSDSDAINLQQLPNQLPEPTPTRFERFKAAVSQVMDRSGVEYLNDPTRGPLL
jgi:hypothetical protein